MAHHGSFSRPTETEAREAVRSSVETMQKAFAEANVVIVTFGTAWIYEMNGKVVGNCHKLPAEAFTRRRLSVDEIVETWRPILKRWSDKHWIFTVSPIRHVKDGLHENQLSKATLLLAVERLIGDTGLTAKPVYFDSFEILLDELRDYRFYADDLVHPSSMAVKYIWERFAEQPLLRLQSFNEFIQTTRLDKRGELALSELSWVIINSIAKAYNNTKDILYAQKVLQSQDDVSCTTSWRL